MCRSHWDQNLLLLKSKTYQNLEAPKTLKLPATVWFNECFYRFRLGSCKHPHARLPGLNKNEPGNFWKSSYVERNSGGLPGTLRALLCLRCSPSSLHGQPTHGSGEPKHMSTIMHVVPPTFPVTIHLRVFRADFLIQATRHVHTSISTGYLAAWGPLPLPLARPPRRPSSPQTRSPLRSSLLPIRTTHESSIYRALQKKHT